MGTFPGKSQACSSIITSIKCICSYYDKDIVIICPIIYHHIISRQNPNGDTWDVVEKCGTHVGFLMGY